MFPKINSQLRIYPVLLTFMLFGCQQRLQLQLQLQQQLQQQPNLQQQRSKQGMAVSAHPLASDAGLRVLQQGGNAVDAAVATALAISVVEPFSAGIGGGGFLLLRRAETGTVQALDFRERAPKRATRDMYLDKQGKVRQRASLDGHLAAGIPGTVGGLYTVHREYGKLPWATVVAPTIALAENGFPVSSRLKRIRRRGQFLPTGAFCTNQGNFWCSGIWGGLYVRLPLTRKVFIPGKLLGRSPLT
jgi:gamma-glutamyltranspeptidase / glutathione hydrolase